MPSLPYLAGRSSALLALLLTLPFAGCGSGIAGLANQSGILTPPAVTAPANGAAALAYVSAPVIAAGSASAALTLHGAGIAAGATLLLDGVRHAASFVSGTEMTVTLSAAEVASPARHTLQIANPSVPVSNALPLLVTSGYVAFGDSITYGATLSDPSTQAYPHLLAAGLSLPGTDSGIPGDQACDIFGRQIAPNAVGLTAAPAALYSVLIGTNDVDGKGTGAYESTFRNCHNAVLTWLGTQRADKVLPGDAAFTASGGCTATAASASFGAAPCSGAGGFTASVVSTGNPVYVWYLLSDAAAGGANLAVQMDGASGTTVSTLPSPHLATQNGSSFSIGVVRLPAAAGTHTVAVSAAAGAALLGVGSNRGGPLRPELVVGDLPNQLATNLVSSVASQLQYSADIQADMAAAVADGIDVRFAPDRSSMLGAPDEMNDSLHPNTLGQQHLFNAFLNALY